jgi:thiaminase
LTDGTLSRDRFRFYAVPDALYLREVARVLALTAARAPADEFAAVVRAVIDATDTVAARVTAEERQAMRPTS